MPEHARLSRHVIFPSRRYHIIRQTITLSIELHLSFSASLLTPTSMIDNGVKIVSHKQSPEILVPDHAATEYEVARVKIILHERSPGMLIPDAAGEYTHEDGAFILFIIFCLSSIVLFIH
jgi:hypothetical protein